MDYQICDKILCLRTNHEYQAPLYLVELCQPVAGVASRQHLWSATQQLLVIPHHQLNSYGRRAFCVAGPSVWNSLLDSLRNPIIGQNSFRQSLKTFLYTTYCCIQCVRGFTTMHYISRLFTYLLTFERDAHILFPIPYPLPLHPISIPILSPHSIFPSHHIAPMPVVIPDASMSVRCWVADIVCLVSTSRHIAVWSLSIHLLMACNTFCFTSKLIGFLSRHTA